MLGIQDELLRVFWKSVIKVAHNLILRQTQGRSETRRLRGEGQVEPAVCPILLCSLGPFAGSTWVVLSTKGRHESTGSLGQVGVRAPSLFAM